MGRVWRTLLTVLLVACCAFPAVYMNSIYGYLPIFLVGAAFLLSFLGVWGVRRRLEAGAEGGGGECERGAQVSAGLHVTNRSHIVPARTSADIYTSDIYGGADTVSRVNFFLAPGRATEFGVNVEMPHIGVYRAGIRGMTLTDFFGCIRLKVPVKGEFEVFVRPRVREMQGMWDAEEVLAEAASDTRRAVSGGMDYVGVREYETGDSMKQIHWKLSAHSRTYLTKLQESNRETDYAIVLDFAAEPSDDAETLMDIQDCLIETALSVVGAVARHHTNYSLLYCSREGIIVRTTPKGREDDLDLIKEFSPVTPAPPPGYPDALYIMQEEGSVAARCTNVIVCTSRVTDGLIQELLRIRRQRRMPELFEILPAGLNSREAETHRARLRALDEAGVRHYFVYTTDAGGIQGGGDA